jgi:anaerobic ribonucleoside-triphosphate reductase activating protein
MQGCSRKCHNCYNKSIQKKNSKKHSKPLYKIDQLYYDIIGARLDGVTISGGEPFEQPEALYDLLILLNEKIEKLPLGIIVFTGYTIQEIRENPLMIKCVDLIDLIIEGEYIDGLNCSIGSSNQNFIYSKKQGRGKALLGEVKLEPIVEIHPLKNSPDFIVTGFPIIDKKKLKNVGIEFIDN